MVLRQREAQSLLRGLQGASSPVILDQHQDQVALVPGTEPSSAECKQQEFQKLLQPFERVERK